VFGKQVVGWRSPRTVGAVEISPSAAAITNLASGRLQTEVATKVLDKVLDTQTQIATSLIEALSVSVPSGLTFSQQGSLSAGQESRYIADL